MLGTLISQYLEYILAIGGIAAFIVFIKVARGSGKSKAIMLACQYGDEEEVRKTLLEVPWLARVSDTNGFTPLHVAALWGHVDIVQMLLKHKADPNAHNNAGMAPLHGAAMAGHMEVVQLLLEHGAEVNAADNIGNTPLYFAAWDGHEAVAKLLLDHGADRGAVTHKGESALQRANLHGHSGLVEILNDKI